MKRFAFNAIPDCMCIYKISNTQNDKVYIGTTTSLRSRIINHRYDSLHRKSNCPKLYTAIDEIGSDNFFVEIIEEFAEISIDELYNKESEYIIKYNSINDGYNERQDIDGKCITSKNTSEKMSTSGKQVWIRGGHKKHAEKLSKFKYNVYSLSDIPLDSDITLGKVINKYDIRSSNIFTKMKNECIKEYGIYDETVTVKTKFKSFYVERIYIGGTKRGDYKGDKIRLVH